MKNFYAVLLTLSLLLTLVIPATAQTAEPTPLPSILGTEAAPIEEVSTPVENALEETDRLVRVVEVLVILIGALVGSSIVVLGGVGLVLVRFGLTIAGLLASLTPSQRDDALVKQLTQAFDERYPDTPHDIGRPQ